MVMWLRHKILWSCDDCVRDPKLRAAMPLALVGNELCPPWKNYRREQSSRKLWQPLGAARAVPMGKRGRGFDELPKVFDSDDLGEEGTSDTDLEKFEPLATPPNLDSHGDPSRTPVLSIYIIFFFFFYEASCHDDERSALLHFKDSFLRTNSCYFRSDYSKVESWNSSRSGDCCLWEGVGCENESNHVISLDLSNSCINASINFNSTLFALVHLRSLNLAYNSFGPSQIPSSIGNLSSLTYLNLSYSDFSGQIPSQLLNLSNLVSLDLSNNYGLNLHKPSFSDMVRQLTNLKELHLSIVRISSSVPDLLSNFSSLESLRLDLCGLTGEFPVAIFQLPNLKVLDLSHNFYLKVDFPSFQFGSPLKSLKLTGTNSRSVRNSTAHVPTSIGNLIYMEELALSDCSFIPSSIENLVHLKSLRITYCIFTDQISPTFSNFTKLVYLYFSQNHFNIHPPTTSSFTWIGKLPKLTQLFLNRINMKGEIPFNWLMNLTQLSHLHMYNNKLIGPIPSSLMNLTHLTSIDLSSNQLSGQIPLHIGHLTFLSHLDLSSNKLEGQIPTSLFDLNGLRMLDLSLNKLIGTFDFTVFSQLNYLYSLSLSNNYNLSLITTTESNVTFKNMVILGLGSCNLFEFPSFLHNKLDWLAFLDLSSNNIHGQIPSWAGLKSLQNLNLSHNHLTGFDNDSSILRWAKLRTLDLRYNMLKGSLLMPPSSTSFYLVSHNRMSGELSPSICNLNSLEMFDLSFNNFSGKLPQCLGNFSDFLSLLDLKRNSFHGTIPSMWRNECKLKMISMSHNQLQGPLPRSLQNCSLLEMVDFGSNQIVDAFPSWFGSLPNLKILILRSNQFYGTMENLVATGFSDLRVIDLSYNHLSGKLPSKLLHIWNAMKVRNTSYMTYMQDYMMPNHSYADSYFGYYDYSMTLYNKGLEMNYMKIPDILLGIDFSNNKFQGEIPDMIGNLKGLQLLNLSRNILQGPIPSSLANLKALECLDLSQNQLSGQIPTMLTEITTLSSFSVSFNQLSGPIPQGNQFCTFEANTYDGNPGLWVETWTKQCGNASVTSSSYGR
ncbi:receptor-like protein 6 [Mercurialis annua]|uniref:receptor-like protein 6 n=1 Tax=Mercurialis annua TaxID=3986 RepID=UPI0024AEF7A3|nr:receptor-like protein 6 [Mercurialis annua]